MLLRRPAVDVALGRERRRRRPAPLRRSRDHRVAVDALLEPEVDAGVRPGIEQVVALVLRVVHPEHVLDVFGERMDLEREVAAAHRVEEIEADRELVAEARMDRLAQQRARLVRRPGRAKGSRPASRRSRAAGCSPRARSRSTSRSSARRRSRSQTSFIHCPPHGAGIEERHHAERAASPRGAARAARVAVGQLRAPRGCSCRGRNRRGRDERAFPAVGHAPVHEEGALVELRGGGPAVRRPPRLRSRAAAAAAGSPSGRGPRRPARRARARESRPGADDEDDPPLTPPPRRPRRTALRPGRGSRRG